MFDFRYDKGAEKHGIVARLLNYQMVMRMAHRYFLTTNVYHGFSILVYHGLQKSTMVYKSLPWSAKVHHGPQRSRITLELKRETETSRTPLHSSK